MEDCIFCRIARGEAHSWKVYEDEYTYAFLDIHPMNPYHTPVIPKKHYENIFDIPKKELTCIMHTVKRIVDLYRNKLELCDVQIISSSGAAAQQDVFHIHFHIVPRHAGDGQDVVWSTHPEWRETYPDLLAKLTE